MIDRERESGRQAISRRRVLVAFLLSPLVIAVITFIGYCTIQRVYSHAAFSLSPLVIIFVYCCFFSLVPAYATELVLGLPVWLLLRRYGVRSVSVYLISGAVIGLVAIQILLFWFFPSWIDWVEYLLTPVRWINVVMGDAVLGGALTAVLFRRIAFARDSSSA